jgi:phosphate transport system permease protein
MTATTLPAATQVELHARRLPKVTPWVLAVVALGLSFLLFDVVHFLGGGNVLVVVGTAVWFVLLLSIASVVVEGRRVARNRIATTLVYAALVVAMVPLVSVVATLLGRGRTYLTPDFFTHSMAGVGAYDATGGMYAAIIGTLEQVGIAIVLTVPLGIAGAIYIVEYGRGVFATMIRFFVDVMTGIPSIVAGLFLLAFWVSYITPLFNNGLAGYSGFAAALALSVLMLPTVTRAAEEMLRLVPAALREGSYALGVAKWKTIVRIVVPTAAPGIVTGVMLAIARAAGETAPVLVTAGNSSLINYNPFKDPQASWPVFIYQQITNGGKYGPARAWAAALTLVAVVLSLTIAAKALSRRGSLSR